jgi:hypothetical protein
LTLSGREFESFFFFGIVKLLGGLAISLAIRKIIRHDEFAETLEQIDM